MRKESLYTDWMIDIRCFLHVFPPLHFVLHCSKMNCTHHLRQEWWLHLSTENGTCTVKLLKHNGGVFASCCKLHSYILQWQHLKK